MQVTITLSYDACKSAVAHNLKQDSMYRNQRSQLTATSPGNSKATVLADTETVKVSKRTVLKCSGKSCGATI